MHGRGVYTWPDGKRYEGSYKNGHRDGLGKLTRPNGNYYSGGWVKGKEHGDGELYIAETGQVKQVRFEAGRKVKLDRT